jgi:hypothetical protein
MTQPAAAHPVGVRDGRLERVRTFIVRERSLSVLIILLVGLGLGGIVLRVFFFNSWFLWFWAMTAFTALELLAIASWDLIVDLRGGIVHLVTDQRAPWPLWVQRSLVPALLIAGIVFDHFVVH